MCREHAEFVSNSPDETTKLAKRTARVLSIGDVLLLSGPVGAGKTHFARAVIQEMLEKSEDVPSPTYTLVQTYATQKCEIWHADLYRISDTGEIIELGLTDAFSNAICLVEWPEVLGDYAPENALTLAIEPLTSENERHFSLSWIEPGWTNRVSKILHE
ncbi:MAG: tRNA (adenosine(37)-N6)-threonylcarbamoyltransferase complex ATPase subunit type 1 TsaE [Pseudomonadota bacterium]